MRRGSSRSATELQLSLGGVEGEGKEELQLTFQLAGVTCSFPEGGSCGRGWDKAMSGGRRS